MAKLIPFDITNDLLMTEFGITKLGITSLEII